MLRINPTNMTPEERAALDYLFATYDEKTQFNPSISYKVVLPDKNTGLPKKTLIELTHEMIKHDCRPGGKHDGQWRYEVVAEKPLIGSGSYSSVLKTIGTFVPSMNNQPAHYKEKERVMKCFKTKGVDSSDDEDFVPFEYRDIKREYDLTPPHLSMKPPVKLEDDWCVVMKLVKGKSLKKIIDAQSLSGEQRISLCIAIAEALQHQVHDFNEVHRDFKPDNILVRYDESHHKWIVTIIDFGLSKWLHEDDTKYSPGTPLYASPDARKEIGTTFKSDIFSLACIFSEILGCKRGDLIKTWKDLNLETTQNHIHLQGLFQNSSDIDPILQIPLEELLKQMSRSNPDPKELIKQRDSRPSSSEVAKRLKSFSLFTLKEEETENNNTKKKKPLSTSDDKLLAPLTNLKTLS